MHLKTSSAKWWPFCLGRDEFSESQTYLSLGIRHDGTTSFIRDQIQILVKKHQRGDAWNGNVYGKQIISFGKYGDVRYGNQSHLLKTRSHHSVNFVVPGVVMATVGAANEVKVDIITALDFSVFGVSPQINVKVSENFHGQYSFIYGRPRCNSDVSTHSYTHGSCFVVFCYVLMMSDFTITYKFQFSWIMNNDQSQWSVDRGLCYSFIKSQILWLPSV